MRRTALLERNWCSPNPRLRAPPIRFKEPNRKFTDALLLLSGGRYLVTSSGIGSSGGFINVWDMATGGHLTSFAVRNEDIILQWRAVDDGCAVMFLVRDGILSECVDFTLPL